MAHWKTRSITLNKAKALLNEATEGMKEYKYGRQ
jgi:hypothetical protein